ncbi:MAG: selenocysteine-specific translation elongation factor [Actinomycetota bacterium]
MHVIGTAGHVDHGKSTLVERLTGIDPDRFAEEKRRGLTIDLGFAWLRLPAGREIGLIDVPGHERFIKNMLAGAGGITVCLFVVAANEGWMPQSAEHLSALDVLGITSGVVALTKSDTVDEETLEIARVEVEEHIAHSTLAGAPVVACSATTGRGIDELVAALDTVIAAAPPAPDLGRPRLWVDRVFTVAGAGTVVTGTLAGGGFAVGEEVEIAPAGRRARIRTIQSHKKEVSSIGPGNRVALNLAGLERQGAERGDAIVGGDQWRNAARIAAWLRVLPAALSGHEHELSEKGAHLLYVGSAETPVRIKLLDADKLAAGETGFAQLYLRDPLPLRRGDRFVLRDAGRVRTFGGGEVLDPAPPRRVSVELMERLREAAPEDALAALVESEGEIVAADALARSGAVEIPATVARLGPIAVSKGRLDELASVVRGALERHHENRPLERGLSREGLRAATGLGAGAFDALVARLDDVVEDGATVRLASFSVELAPEQRRARDALIDEISSAGFAPPVEKDLKADPALLRALVDAQELIKLGDFYLTRAQADEARRRVREHIESSGEITVAEIRDLLGTSRKYAVPLCEWLDQTGATRRRGDVRVLGPNP